MFAGLTYKKNVSDLRNSQSLKIFQYFKKKNKKVLAYDPYVEKNLPKGIIDINKIFKLKNLKCVVLLVEHNYFEKILKKIDKKFN